MLTCGHFIPPGDYLRRKHVRSSNGSQRVSHKSDPVGPLARIDGRGSDGIWSYPRTGTNVQNCRTRCWRRPNIDPPGGAPILLATVGVGLELRGVAWEKIDLAAKVWTVPATRMKAGKEHRIPLSTQALVLLQFRYAVTMNPFIGSRRGASGKVRYGKRTRAQLSLSCSPATDPAAFVCTT